MFRQKHTVRNAKVLMITFAIAFHVGGCTMNDPVDSITDETRASTSRPSVPDKEILESAKSAYDRYLAVADQILADGGNSSDRIDAVASDEYAETFALDAAEYSAAALRTVGTTEIKFIELQSWALDDDGFSISTYVCDDVAGIDVLDAEGKSVVSSERDSVTPYQVRFQGKSLDELTVSAKDYWTGADFCGA